MPPKQKESGKTVQKKVAKIVEDRTFGLKNKNKSKKVQQHIKQVQVNAKHMGKSHKQVLEEEKARQARLMKKEVGKQMQEEMASLFKAVTSKKDIPSGVDPKSIICEHFKAGACKYGKKCKYSHDFEQVRKVAKINLYIDPRDIVDEKNPDAKKSVVKRSETMCNYFLDAVENSKYGWLWVCPNGGNECGYKHALPEGYVVKKKEEKKKPSDEEEDSGPTLEETLETERAKLDLSKCTPVTLETFLKWKEDRKKKREADIEKQRKEAEAKSGGKGLDVLSGRALFTYDPSLFIDDQDAADDLTIQSDVEDSEDEKEKGKDNQNEGEKVPIDESLFAGEDDVED